MEDSRADRLENKIDKIMEKLTEIAVNQAEDEADHKALTKRVSEVEHDLKPIQRHITRVEGVAKALGVLSLCATIAGGIAALFQRLH